MMSTQSGAATLYPPGGFGAPKNRHGHAGADVGLRHNESMFGYAEQSLASVAHAVGAENAAKILSGNIIQFSGL